MGFLVIAVCAYYLTGNGLPTSTVTIQRDDDLFDVAVASLQKLEQPRSVLIAAKITSNWDSGSDSNSNSACSDSDDKSAIMKMEPNFGTHLYWYYWQPLWVQRGFLADSGGGNGYAQEFLSITTWSRSPRVMEKIVSRWFEEYRGKEATYTVIREANSEAFNPWSSKIIKLSRPLKSILLPKEVKDEIIKDLEDYTRPSTRRWYTKRGYPYRRGHLFYGKPGTGKSSLTLALAAHLGLELYIVPINNPEFDQETLASMFRSLRDPCMVLLEDVDALNTTTHQRGSSRRSQSGHSNLSTLLNLLDGVAAKEGVILIMTSNHLEVLDDALVRPGRIDKKVHFTNATQYQLHGLFLITYLSDASEEVHQTSAVKNEKIPTPVISDEEIHKLAERFSTTLPSNEFTVAEVQGYLFPRRQDPRGALAGAAAWSEQKSKERLNPAAEGSLETTKPESKEDILKNKSDDKSLGLTEDTKVASTGEWSEENSKDHLNPVGEGSLKDEETDRESDESVKPTSTG